MNIDIINQMGYRDCPWCKRRAMTYGPIWEVWCCIACDPDQPFIYYRYEGPGEAGIFKVDISCEPCCAMPDGNHHRHCRFFGVPF